MRTFLQLTAVACMITFALFGQDGKAKAKAPPKNLKILTPETYRPLMDVFVASLGLADKGGCNYCHVGPGQMDKDDNPKKDTARMMLTMVREINGKFPADGKQRVTCYTCHRGEPIPSSAAPKQ
jgi:photosynthetic reaction center cytochrome c subunit